MKIRERIKKIRRKSKKPKVGSLKKINKTDTFSARLTRRERKHGTTKTRKKVGTLLPSPRD